MTARNRTRIIVPLILCLAQCIIATLAAQEADPARAVPAEAIGYVDLGNPQAFMEALKTTEANDIVRQSQMLSSGLKMGMGIVEFFASYACDVDIWDLLENKVQRLSLAILDISDESPLQQGRVVFIASLGGNSDEVRKMIDERMLSRLKLVAKDATLTREDIAGVRVDILTPQGKAPAAIAVCGNMLLFGTPEAVSLAVRTSVGERASILEVSQFRAVRESTSVKTPGAFSIYVDMESLLWKSQRRTRLLKDVEGERFMGFDRMKAVGGSCEIADGMFNSHILMAMEQPPVGLLGMISRAAPGSLAGVAYVPDDYDYLISLDIGDGDALTAGVQEFLAPVRPDILDSARQFNGALMQFQVNFYNEFVKRFGGEFFFAMKMPDLAELMAQPEAQRIFSLAPIMGFEVKEPDQIIASLKKLAGIQMLAAQGIKLEEQQIGDHTAYVLRANGQPINGVEFTAALAENHLLVTFTLDSMTDALEAFDAKNTLEGGQTYQYLRGRLPTEAGMLIYADPRKILDGAISMSLSGGKIEANAAPFFHEFQRALPRYKGLAMTASGDEGGVMLDWTSPLGEAALLNMVLVSPHLKEQRWTDSPSDLALRRVNETGRAIRMFHAKNIKLPGKLDDLVPYYLDSVPKDPFADGAEIRFIPGADGKGWILASVGPDGRADIPAEGFDPAAFIVKLGSKEPAAREEIKELLHKYEPAFFAGDESADDDEGDIAVWGQ
ncbi:MAG TPA: hypothetical protein PL033_01335 [Candidatus Brocadiia bacterium]|nr:hypothetical protein [Candidatus Brocadiia bacterium]